MSEQEPTRTLWSKSLFEGLYLAIEKSNRNAVKVAVADLRSKDFPMQEILRHVRTDMGADTEAKLKRLMQASGKNDKPGLVTKLKGFFS